MIFYSFLKYYSIVCLDFSPWGGGFSDTFDWPFVSHPGEFDQKILKFVKPYPHGVCIDRCISLRCKRSILSFLPVYITKKNVKSVIDSAVVHWTTRLMVFPRNAGFGRCYLVSTRHENLLQPELGRGSEKT